MIVSFIAFVVCLGILWASGVLGDMLVWLITKAIPWAFFPVVFFLSLFWITDQLSVESNLIVSVSLAILYCVGGVIQFVMTFYLADGLLSIRRVTRWDTYNHWSIKPRIRIFAVLAIVVGGVGVWDPYPLQGVFVDHKAGLSWRSIFDRAVFGRPAGAPGWAEATPPPVETTKNKVANKKERNPFI